MEMRDPDVRVGKMCAVHASSGRKGMWRLAVWLESDGAAVWEHDDEAGIGDGFVGVWSIDGKVVASASGVGDGNCMRRGGG